MKRILFVHHGGGVGGAPISMLQLAAALDRTRFEPVIVFTAPGPIIEFALKLGLQARVVRMPAAFVYGAHIRLTLRMLGTFFFWFLPTILAARKLVRQIRPDIIHLNTSVLVPVALGIKTRGIPLVWHVREAPGTNSFWRRYMTHTIASLADRVITNSRYVADAYCAEDSRLTDRVRIIYNAIDLGRFSLGEAAVRLRIRSELNVPYDTPVVIMIGNVQTVKGHFLLAEAACSVVKRYPETRFVIVAGSVGPNYASSLRGRIKSMLKLPYDNLSVMKSVVASAGQGSSFVFIGNRSDIPELLAASDILVFIPQKAEGFGRPLIEAMAAGIPVVATDIGPTREILGEGTGVLVETGSSEVVARALVTLLSDQELCGKMGRSGRERATQLFSIHDYCAKVTKVYEEVSSS